MRIFVLDDDRRFAETVRSTLDLYFEGIGKTVEVLVFSTPDGLFSELSCRPDILFTDIELSLKGINGIDVAKRVKHSQPACQVIFLTSYLNYATEVYEAEPFWFIVKDELKQRLPIVMERYFRNKTGRSAASLVISYGHEKVILNQSEIIYCEVKQRKISVVCKSHTEYTYEPLASIQATLDSSSILRCHNSFLVNLEQVTKFHPAEFEMSNGDKVPISRRCRDSAKHAFLSYMASELGFDSGQEDSRQ